MIYNPYLNLIRFAGMNVLQDEDFHSTLYPVFDGYAYLGAVTASLWLINGKGRSKEVEINQVMEDVRHLTDASPFSVEVARGFVEKGFNWLVSFELDDVPQSFWEMRRKPEAA